MMRRLRDLLNHPMFIKVFALVSVSAFGLAALALAMTMAQDSRREQDRIVSDINTCERVNVLRGQVVDGFTATELAFDRVLDVFLPGPTGEPARDARVAELRSQIAPILVDLHATLDGVEFTDCEAVVPGARKAPREGS